MTSKSRITRPARDDLRPQPDGRVAESEQEPQLRPPKGPVGDLERPAAAGGQRDVDGEEQVGQQKRNGQPGRHPPRGRQSQEEGERTERVDHVIDVEAVTRARALPVAGQGPVQAVAEPVGHEGDVHGQEQQRPARGERVGGARREHGHEPEYGQVIGADARGHAGGQEQQQAALGLRGEARELAAGLDQGGGGHDGPFRGSTARRKETSDRRRRVPSARPKAIPRVLQVPREALYAFRTPSDRPTLVKAATAWSMWAGVWAAETCTRIRESPRGTTGKKNPLT